MQYPAGEPKAATANTATVWSLGQMGSTARATNFSEVLPRRHFTRLEGPRDLRTKS